MLRLIAAFGVSARTRRSARMGSGVCADMVQTVRSTTSTVFFIAPGSYCETRRPAYRRALTGSRRGQGRSHARSPRPAPYGGCDVTNGAADDPWHAAGRGRPRRPRAGRTVAEAARPIQPVGQPLAERRLDILVEPRSRRRAISLAHILAEARSQPRQRVDRLRRVIAERPVAPLRPEARQFVRT